MATYAEVTQRVLVLVEKNGDARYNATANGQQKLATYLQFVLEAERDIIRREGYWQWLRKSANVPLVADQAEYALPADLQQLDFIRPSWNMVPLEELTPRELREKLATVSGGGRPSIFAQVSYAADQQTVLVFPTPNQAVEDASGALVVEYFRAIDVPADPSTESPSIPTQHLDVLIYGAAAHALLLDPDARNAQMMMQAYAGKLSQLRRANNRKVGSRQTQLVSIADARRPSFYGPETRFGDRLP